MVHIIIGILFLSFSMGSFYASGGSFVTPLPAKDQFDCTQCTQHSCKMDFSKAAHCLSWCDTKSYARCWQAAEEMISFSERMAKDHLHLPATSPFLELYSKLSAKAKTALHDFLNNLSRNDPISETEHSREQVEDIVLQELRSLHHEAQKEKAVALSAGMQIVP